MTAAASVQPCSRLRPAASACSPSSRQPPPPAGWWRSVPQRGCASWPMICRSTTSGCRTWFTTRRPARTGDGQSVAAVMRQQGISVLAAAAADLKSAAAPGCSRMPCKPSPTTTCTSTARNKRAWGMGPAHTGTLPQAAALLPPPQPTPDSAACSTLRLRGCVWIVLFADLPTCPCRFQLPQLYAGPALHPAGRGAAPAGRRPRAGAQRCSRQRQRAAEAGGAPGFLPQECAAAVSAACPRAGFLSRATTHAHLPALLKLQAAKS